MVKLSIIVPVYNEEGAILDTINRLKEVQKKIKDSSEIIVVNDGSTDKTRLILNDIPGIKHIGHNKNKGYGASLKTGIKEASGEFIAITDADGTYPVEDIPMLYSHMNKYDMVVGSRTKKGAKIPLVRRPAKFMINKLAEHISQTKIPDLNSGLRIFKKDIAIRYWNLFPEGFSFTTTITLATMTNDYNVKFIPINYYKREGKSSIKPIKDTANFISLIIRMMTYFRPLRILAPLGIFLFLAGLIKAIYDLFNNNYIGAGSIMVILTGIQIIVLGLIADLIIKRTKL
nr:hypothetical protein [Nanoarchaeum sp.]